MANITGELTLEDIDILRVDDDPSAGAGTVAPQGSIAFALINSVGTLWIKKSATATDWVQFVDKGILPKYYRSGFIPSWVSNTQITLSNGDCTDSTGLFTIQRTSGNFTLDLTVSGAGGLDTGSRTSNTWYYVWVIATTGGTFSAIFSTSSSSPSMPAGYTYKRILPIALKTNASSNIIEFCVGDGWPTLPVIRYCTAFDAQTSNPTFLFSGNATTTFTTLNCSNYIPPISSGALFYIQTFGQLKLRPNGATHNGKTIGGDGDGGTFSGSPIFNHDGVYCKVNSSQQIQYASASGTIASFIAVSGFIVDGVV